MRNRIASIEIRTMFTPEINTRLTRLTRQTGRTKTTVVQIAVSEYLDRIEAKQRQSQIEANMIKRGAFVPTVEDNEPRRKRGRPRKDSIPQPIPQNIPILGDVPNAPSEKTSTSIPTRIAALVSDEAE